METLSGVFTAIITPFHNGVIALDEFKSLVKEQAEAKVTGIVVSGTTGEAPTLSESEFKQLLDTAIEAASGKIKVFAGVGSCDTKSAVHKTKIAEEHGVDGLLAVTPYYNKPTQSGLIDYYSQIADSTNLPIMLYSIPSRCGVEIAVQTAATLHSKHKNIVAIKEATDSCKRISSFRRSISEDFSIFSGDDVMTLPFMSLGAKGVVSVLSHFFPHEMVNMANLCNNNKFHDSLKIFAKLEPALDVLFIETNPLPTKYLLKKLGKISSCECRSPIGALGTNSMAELDKVIPLLNSGYTVI